MRDLAPETVALLDSIAESEDVAPIDLALARMLAEHDPERAREVALAAALVSAMQRRGHTAVELEAWAGDPFPGTDVPLPEAGLWRQRLNESAVVSDSGTVAPLVLDADGRLYLYRLWRAEGRVARRIAELVGATDQAPEAVAEPFAALFPDAASGDRQALAAAGALRHRLAVVAGGPGTGKTTTVAKLLALLLTADPDLSIALATPTGKASNRLTESIRSRSASLSASESVRQRLAGEEAVTLHRLLKYSPTRRAWGRGPSSPIPADVVVVDETSMADLLLFDALLASLRPGARLVLLGDADQLPSVGAGAVFGDLCEAGARDAIGPGFQAFCDVLGVQTPEAAGGAMRSSDEPPPRSNTPETAAGSVPLNEGDNPHRERRDGPDKGSDLIVPLDKGDSFATAGEQSGGSPDEHARPDSSAAASGAMADAVVRLTVSHRFSDDSGIGRLASALRDGHQAGVREVLAPEAQPAGASGDIACLDPAHRAEAIWTHAERHARALCTSDTPEAALSSAAAFRMLAPTRGGRWGVRALNRLIERRLSEEGLRLSPTDPWYHGRPILVTENDYDRELFNGDVGVVWRPAASGGAWRQRPVVVFEGQDGVREIPVAQLPEHETAWAMTIHKSQGSEFDDVLVVLPSPGSAQAKRLTRQLVYTAVTRAKGAPPEAQHAGASGAETRPSLTILGTVEQMAEAAGVAERRASGLAARLRALSE